MNKFLKKILGIEKIENEIAASIQQKLQAEEHTKKAFEEAENARLEAERARQEAYYSKLSPKELANEKKEPYIAVLETRVNDQNPRNGFFELDWNEHFITFLKSEGYFGETEEEIVDTWWREVCRNVAAEEGISMDRRGSGYINVTNLGNGMSEIG